MDDIVHRLREASIRDQDIYRLLQAAAHHIVDLEAQVARCKELHQQTNPAEGIPS